MEKCGKFWKNVCFSGGIWPDWGKTARADMAGLGSIGLKDHSMVMSNLPTNDAYSYSFCDLSLM